jgi:hypothetical protein
VVDHLIADRLRGTEQYVARQRAALDAVNRRLAAAGQAGAAPAPEDVAAAQFHEAEIYDKEMSIATAYASWFLAFMPVYVTVVLAVLVPLWRLDPLPLWASASAWWGRRRRGAPQAPAGRRVPAHPAGRRGR